MLQKVIPLIFSVIGVSFICCAARLVEFNRSFQDLEKITTLQAVSMDTCEHECQSRRGCKSAVYYKRYGYCILTANHRVTRSTIMSKGSVILSDLQPANEASEFATFPNCDGNVCSVNETCSTKQSGSQFCQMTECEIPRSNYSVFLGNLNNIGSKLLGVCRPFDMQIMCGQDGKWIPDISSKVYDCADVSGVSGIYTVMSNHDVYCDMDTDGGHWLVFQRRQDGSVNFYRGWAEYRKGFGDKHGEFWLGLELLHNITNGGSYELRIDMEDSTGNKRFARYSTFSIAGERDNYRLNISGYTGDTSGDSLSEYSGAMFTTIDRDNDWALYENCANLWHGAWWYGACHHANLNGLYLLPGGGYTPVFGQHIHWSTWLGQHVSLRKTEMKIRRKCDVS